MLFMLSVLLPALLACFVMTLLFGYLGLHVLKREVMFVDIAMAQIAALGTAVASLLGVEPHTATSYVFSLGFTLLGAALFAAARALKTRIPQEAFIGIAYAVAAALAVLVANALPHGDEEIREILVGSLLTIELAEVAQTAAIFAGLGVLHFLLRRVFWTLSFEPQEARGWNLALWDFLFYVTLGVAVTSAVHMAGVLLVFSFLVVPAVFSALFAQRLVPRLLIGWAMGSLVSAGGLLLSFELDWPAGATVVLSLGAVLAAGAVVHAVAGRRARGPSAMRDAPTSAGAGPA